MDDKPKCCEKCRLLWPVFDIMQRITQKPELGKRVSMEYKYVISQLETCPNKCLRWLEASNCTINDDGTVNVNNSGKRY